MSRSKNDKNYSKSHILAFIMDNKKSDNNLETNLWCTLTNNLNDENRKLPIEKRAFSKNHDVDSGAFELVDPMFLW